MPLDRLLSSTTLSSADSFDPQSLPLALRGMVAAAKRLRFGWLTLILPNGEGLVFQGAEPGPHGCMVLRNARAARRMALGGDMGLAESYMDGDWDSPDLAGLIQLASVNEQALRDDFSGAWPTRLAHRLIHLMRPNSRNGSRKNISAHYDLGNDFYEHWLDETMTYSAAFYTSQTCSLAEAQREKYRRLARSLNLKPGMSVLEIGCGWGGFAEIAAKEFGCTVTGLTLSTEQAAFARLRMARQGLDDKVTIALRDYRDQEGQFDAIASIEMFEAVGEAYWPHYFNALKQRLKLGGKAALQVITISEDRFEDYRKSCDFIQRYIFPGGLLPSPSALRSAAAEGGFYVAQEQTFGEDYARTLNAWGRSFQHAWPEISELGYDARFKRLWEYYLAYCEAGFRTGAIDVGHFVLERP